MQRTPLLCFSIACLVVSVGCIIAAVIVVQKKVIVPGITSQAACEDESGPTLAPGTPCRLWKYNSCVRGTVDGKGVCKVRQDKASSILMIVALVSAVLWIATLVWGLSLPTSVVLARASGTPDGNVNEAATADQTAFGGPSAEQASSDAFMG